MVRAWSRSEAALSCCRRTAVNATARPRIIRPPIPAAAMTRPCWRVENISAVVTPVLDKTNVATRHSNGFHPSHRIPAGPTLPDDAVADRSREPGNSRRPSRAIFSDAVNADTVPVSRAGFSGCFRRSVAGSATQERSDRLRVSQCRPSYAPQVAAAPRCLETVVREPLNSDEVHADWAGVSPNFHERWILAGADGRKPVSHPAACRDRPGPFRWSC